MEKNRKTTTFHPFILGRFSSPVAFFPLSYILLLFAIWFTKYFLCWASTRRDSIHNRVIPFCVLHSFRYCYCYCLLYVLRYSCRFFFSSRFLIPLRCTFRAPLVKNFQKLWSFCVFRWCTFVGWNTIEIVGIHSHIHWIRGQFKGSIRDNHPFSSTF